ncbi:hypothetical protein CCMA1212_003488 [Trichoderma ghanense]|uniref:Uncharacterized protein n=1 Tax=Trichoderma ghanense TaxID=65468 RepID=A0ABY2H8Y0_9HYPO
MTSSSPPLFPEDSLILVCVCSHLELENTKLEASRQSKRWIAGWAGRTGNLTQLKRRALVKEITLVEDEIESALETRGWWRFNSCLRCRTDFGVVVSPDGRTATIQAWHNFGGEGSPLDAGWRVYTGNLFDAFTRHAHLDYRHGSVRELWFQGVS